MNLSDLILSALAFAAIYPLYFWLPVREPFKSKFRKLNITLPNIAGGFVLISVWFVTVPLPLKIIVTAWKAVLLSVSSYSWKQEYPDPKLMTLPCLLGIYAFIQLKATIDAAGGTVALISLFGR